MGFFLFGLRLVDSLWIHHLFWNILYFLSLIKKNYKMLLGTRHHESAETINNRIRLTKTTDFVVIRFRTEKMNVFTMFKEITFKV